MSAASALFLSAALLHGAPQGVLLEFSSEHCGYCREMSPIVSRLQRQGYPIREINFDRNRELARKFNVGGLPTFVLVVNGKAVNRIEGMTSEGQLRRLLRQIPRYAAENQGDKGSSRPQTSHAEGSSGSPRDDAGSSEEPPEFEDPPVVRAKHDGQNGLPAESAESPLATVTRLRVKAGDGMNYGSGTIIDSRPGRTLILTCGHIFRNYNDDSQIEVDVFGENGPETFVGRLVRHDMEADVGLIAIPTASPLPTTPVASPDTDIARGDAVYSIGCDGGDPPTRHDLQVTALNRYLGPENIECSGVPVQGRSGGGLFNEDGRLIGVCIAADPREKRGLYSGLKPIHTLLADAGISGSSAAEGSQTQQPAPRQKPQEPDFAELEPVSRRDRQEAALSESSSPFDDVPPFEGESPFEREAPSGNAGRPANGAPRPSDTTAASSRRNSSGSNGEVSESETIRTALEQAGDAEVVCIIRPLDDPQAASRVVIINRASSKFVSYLKGELENQATPTMRSVKFGSRSKAEAPGDRSPSSRTVRRICRPERRDSSKAAIRGIKRYRRSAQSRRP